MNRAATAETIERAKEHRPGDNGFICKTARCAKFHFFGAYVYGHWDMKLTHTCSGCGAIHTIYQGKATQSKRGRVPGTPAPGIST